MLSNQFEEFTMLRRDQVQRMSGCSRSTIYQNVIDGLMTKPVKLGARAIGWPAGEIRAINAARIAGATGEQVKTLVASLHAKRLLIGGAA